jgi:AmmeMemoRadiSam system protein B
MPQMIRPPAVAGAFYSANRRDLDATVRGFLEAVPLGTSPNRPKALIVPHAGYVYSGPVAASAYRLLAPLKEQIKHVVLLGPCHRVAIRGLALSSANHFSTPLGEVALDTERAAQLSRLPFVGYSDEAHAQEHSLEVQLPFLQQTLSEFDLLPIACGQASAAEVASVLDLVWGGPETLILVSSDLSHHHDYETAQRMDQLSTSAIEGLAPEKLHDESACGLVPVRGLLLAARERGLSATTLDLRNSGDTAGSKDQVVGYGAYCFA